MIAILLLFWRILIISQRLFCKTSFRYAGVYLKLYYLKLKAYQIYYVLCNVKPLANFY